MVARSRGAGRWPAWWVVAGVAASLLVCAAALIGPRLRYGGTVAAPAWAAGIREGKLSSDYCISCHEEAGAAWRGSHHQLANRPVTDIRPAAYFGGQTLTTHSSTYRFTTASDGHPVIEEQRRDGAVLHHRPSMVIAYAPLRQFLIETHPGRFQTTDTAWDPARQEWFDVFGGEERNPGEWGHWTGQAMNWNSMCARCHMTVYDKAYDEEQDRYQSTWVEHGVGCVQCHGPMTGHEKGGDAMMGVPNISRDPPRMMETCAACHARAEDLTASFPPGETFSDHFRLQLMTEPRLYYPDGQIRDEDFEWGSFRHSKMAAAGVTCLDCHNAHTGKTKLPPLDNALCLQCHSAGNLRNAPVINPTAHSFHKEGSTGNACVACHMPETTYMQRDPRRDHGFLIPDPVLARELSVPDACSRCHADQTLQWNIDAWEKWYGPSGLAEPRRTRARVVARAQQRDASVLPELLPLIEAEKIPAWRASLLTLATQLAAGDPSVARVATPLRSDPDPLVRAAAVRALAGHAPALPLLRESLSDPVRLVRLDAASALVDELVADSPAGREYETYLTAMIDSPVARLRRGQYRFQRGEREAGLADVRSAIALDPLSAPLPETLGFMLNASGRSREAAGQFERAAGLAPEDAALSYYAALAWAEAGEEARAESMFRETVRRDPAQGRAWYNLGLLLAQTGRTAEAIEALQSAEVTTPRDPDAPYAAATIFAQTNRRAEAIDAARRALVTDPDHQPSRELLRALGAESR